MGTTPNKGPLFLHRNGQWCKKIRGRHWYFGTDEAEALALYAKHRADLHAGRDPFIRPEPVGVSIKSVLNAYLRARRDDVEAGELAEKSWRDYQLAALLVLRAVAASRVADDLGPRDWMLVRATLAKGVGPHALTRKLKLVRTMMDWAYRQGHLTYPAKWGGFSPPPARVRRLARASAGARLFDRSEINRLLSESSGPLRAMIYLGINGGMGNTDCATLTAGVVDLEQGVIDYRRRKTGVERTVPLWPETLEALAPFVTGKGDDHLVFVTRYGNAWVRERRKPSGAVVSIDSIRLQFRKLTPTHGFYSLRRTFRTVADDCGDQHAIHRIMGHEIPGMSGVYVQRLTVERLRAVTDHVRAWLLSSGH